MVSGSTSFSARIVKAGNNPCVEVPRIVSQTFGIRGYVPVTGTLNGLLIQSTLVPMRGGGHRLYVNAAMRRKAGVNVGDLVQLILRISAVAQTAIAKMEFLRALARNDTIRARFEMLPAPQQQHVLLYLDSLKEAEDLRRDIQRITGSLIKSPSDEKKDSTQPPQG